MAPRVGAKMRRLRQKKLMSEEDVARICWLGVQAYMASEAGDRRLSPRELYASTREPSVSMVDFFEVLHDEIAGWRKQC